MTRSRARTLVASITLAVLTSAAVGCGSAKPATRTEGGPPPATVDERLARETCTKIFVRQRECTDTFIPALVDLRVRLDRPAGIAASAAEEGGRDALIAQAMEEWKTDSSDEAIAGVCQQMAGRGEDATRMQEAGDKCLAAEGCDAFVECVLPQIEARLSAD